jgi:regulator of protease activity HflC (stomatin/prohibitin superfamily)
MAGSVTTRVQQLMVSTDTKTRGAHSVSKGRSFEYKTGCSRSDNVTVTVQIAVQFRVINEIVIDDEPIAQSARQVMAGRSEHDDEQSLISAPRTTSDGPGYESVGDEAHGVWRAYYKLTDINQQLTPYVEDVVRSEVPRKSLDEAYESKEDLAVAVKTALQHEMKRYGYEIVNALVTDLQPDRRVQDAMNAIEAQRRMRMASQEKAEAEKILIVKAAEADAEAKELSGHGVARQRQAIVSGLKESVLQFNDSVVGTSPADVMQLMMVTQYLDMLKEVGTKQGASTIFIPHAPGAVTQVQEQMRAGFLQANATAANQVLPAVGQLLPE